MKLPLVSSKQLIHALKRAGFKRGKATRGSHQVYIKRVEGRDSIVVSAIEGKKEIPRPTLRDILKQAQLSTEKFLELLR